MEKEIIKFIGEKVSYIQYGTQIFGVNAEGSLQIICDLRGWGAIQNLFVNKDGTTNFADAEQFQDALGEWIADAINQKLNK